MTEKEVNLNEAYQIHEEVDKFLERNVSSPEKIKELVDLLKE